MAGQGIEVGVSFLLENEAEIARIIAQSGGKIGKDFSEKLSAEGKKAFDQLVSAAEKAAQEVGAKFSKTDLRFRNNVGQFLTPKELETLASTNKSFKEAVDSVNKFRSAVESTAQSAKRNFNLIEAAVEGVAISLTSQLTDAITTSLGGVRSLVTGFLDLDGELRLAAAAAGETGGYERLGAIVDKVGIEAAGTTKEVAQLATALTRAGFTIKEIETALPGVVRGAEATGTSFASFGDIVGNTLRGFGLEVEETARVVDVLVNTANSSNASIEGLGYTFEYTAPIAKALGVSLEEVAAAAGLMANAGIQGSVAGTGLRTGLQKLQQAAGGASPEVLGLARGQERLSGIMRKLGADVVDTNGKLLPMERVLISLKNSLGKLNQGDQVQLSTVLFGEEAGPKWLSILNQTDTAITKMFRDLGNSAGSADTARTAMSGMGLELRQLEGTLQSLGTQFGGIIAAGLRPFVALANAASGVISGMPGPVKTTAGTLLTLAVAATAATVALSATRAVVTQIGFSSLAAGAAAAGRSIMAMGAGTTVLLGLVGVVALFSPAFRETDRTTKQLLQTTIALGIGITVFKGIYQGVVLLKAAQLGLNNAQRASAVILAFIQGLNPGKAVLALSVAAVAASAAYATLDRFIKVAGADTEELTSKVNDLKEQIKGVQDEIASSKKLNIDTSGAQRKLDELQAQLQKIEGPLELKIDIQKVESQIRSLEASLSKLGQDAPQRGPIEAELAARKEFLNVLKAADEGTGVKRIQEMSKVSQEIVKQTAAFRDEIDRLNKQKITLPANATAQRNAIDERIAGLQQTLTRKTEREQLELINREIQKKIQLTKAELAETEKAQKLAGTTVSPVFGITNPNADVAPVRSQADLQEKIKSLKREEQLLTQSLVTNQLELENSTKKQERTARGIVQTAKDRLEIAKAKLDTEQMSIDSLDKQASLESKRLGLVREIADAYSGLVNAQANLVQSEFDVFRSRNNRAISVAEQDLQIMKDRGDSANQIQAVEQRIQALKKEGEGIDKRAMMAAIDAAAKRFEIEGKILALKQRSQMLEQQAAIRSADMGVLRERGKLLELQGKLEDPSTTPQAKESIRNQIAIQKQSIDLSKEQLKAEKNRASELDIILGLERQSQAAQQQAAANQQRAAAASRGWEDEMGQRLMNLDAAAGVRLEKTRKLVGEIQVGTRPVEKIYVDTVRAVKATDEASSVWKKVQDSTNKILGTISGHTEKVKDSIKAVKGLASAYNDVNKSAMNAKSLSPGSRFNQASQNTTAHLGPNEAYFKELVEALTAQSKAAGGQISSAYSPNGAFIFERGPDVGKKSWFDKEQLSHIMKLENATHMSADAFFVASDRATHLERSLAAVGKRATELEKIKWYEVALQSIYSGKNPDLFINDRTNSFGTLRSIRADATKLANKESFDWMSPLAGNEGLIDRIAAKFQDLDANAKGLSGSISNLSDSIYGARDEVGRPLDLENWKNYQEYLYNINGLYTNVIGKTDEFGRTIQEKITDKDMTKVYKTLYAITSQTSSATKEAESLQEAYSSLGNGLPGSSDPAQQGSDIVGATQSAVEETKNLKEEWQSVFDVIDQSAKTLKVFAAPTQARFAGGDVEPGHSYQINELGQESWLDEAGRLRLITAPAYSKWSPPSKGLVLPANVTAALKDRGTFDRSSYAATVVKERTGITPSVTVNTNNLSAVVGRLERRMIGMENAMRNWKPMDVTIQAPSSAGHIQAMRGVM